MTIKTNPFDYPALEALNLIQELGTFEEAAKKLKISQSAVSQRVKNLETAQEHKLLLRKSPPELTKAGEALLTHYRKVKKLEEEWAHEFLNKEDSYFHIRLATNRDSLSTWILPLLEPLLKRENVTIEFFPVDQDKTHKLLLDGKVDACISSQDFYKKSYIKHHLGSMKYTCEVSKKLYEAKGKSRKRVLKETPFVLFDRDDKLYENFFSKEEKPKNCHFVPNSTAFKDFIKMGYGYSLVASSQKKPMGELIDLYPTRSIEVPLYWYHWEGISSKMNELFQILITEAPKKL